jgi:hypothetical protein
MKHIWTKNGVEIPYSEVAQGFESYCRTLEPYPREESLKARKAVLEVEGDGVTILSSDNPDKKIFDMYFAWYMQKDGIHYSSED